jgi:tRNA pseudouridine synthase 10
MEKKVQKLYSIILKNLNKYEFNSFLIGFNKHYGDQGKNLKMEIGSKLEKELNKKVDFVRPDIVIVVNLETGKVSFDIKSAYIYGRYNKYQRGLAQTKWNRKEKIYSVEETMGLPFIKNLKGEGAALHGCGREDIDVLMLGDGRPFVLEIKRPKKRFSDLNKIAEKINKKNKDKVKISNLKYTTVEKIKELKEAKADKTYIARVSSKKAFSKEEVEKALKKFNKKTIEQRTPTRVSRRRADLVRKRKVLDIDLLKFKPTFFEIKIKTEGGTYIKELVSGDKGRTTPSLNGLLGGEKKKPLTIIKELDVTKVDF